MESAHGPPAAFPANALPDRTDTGAPRTSAPDEGDTPEQRIRELQAALELKTALIQDAEHRARNTFQVVLSLVLLKARRTPPGEARTVLEVIAERIGALSTAHQVLAAEGDGTVFDLRDVVAPLLSDAIAALPDDRLRVEAEIEAMTLPATMAVPLALMVHELTANALRHAYPGAMRGRVRVDAGRTGASLTVSISDEGVGLTPETEGRHGFGRSLVETVVRQLRGTVAWLPAEPGTRVAIAIPLR